MSEELIVRYCSPTLAGMKTGNIFNCTYSDITEMRDSIRRWNKLLVKKGLRILPLRFQNNRALIYIYRPSRLSRDLRHETASRLLLELGYGMETPERCVVQLKKRLGECEEFPHEIGLFLGYPPEDVCGFIENKAGECKCVGCWKVYGDAEAARKIFAKYKKCTDVYCTQLAHGRSIERLTVNI
ncbi:MAG: DUF3793 family protein [Acutalibacteraceae bacterium]|nr:DUF3793 family protein [Acutalibacteraceae bacterium]